MGFQAVLDANVLLPAPLRDTLLRLAEADLYVPRWSERILAEVARNLVESGRTDSEQATRVTETMAEAFPEARGRGHQEPQGLSFRRLRVARCPGPRPGRLPRRPPSNRSTCHASCFVRSGRSPHQTGTDPLRGTRLRRQRRPSVCGAGSRKPVTLCEPLPGLYVNQSMQGRIIPKRSASLPPSARTPRA